MPDQSLVPIEVIPEGQVEVLPPRALTKPRAERISTALEIAHISEPGRHHLGDGLYLTVYSRERAVWTFRFTLDGKAREMGMGPAKGRTAVSLADAREGARQARALVRKGVDPIRTRDLEEAEAKRLIAERERTEREHKLAEGRTFSAVTEDFLTAQAASWSNAKHTKQWRSTLTRYAFPVIGRMPVAQIATAQIKDVLAPYWLTKHETASRLRGRIEAVLRYAIALGYREGPNPAGWRDSLKAVLPDPSKVAKVKNFRAMPWQEIGAFYAALSAREAPAARATEFVLLTAARTKQATLARWRDVDRDKRVWSAPAETMKMKRDHRVPLSDAALAVLERVRAGRRIHPDDFIFRNSKGKPLSNNAMLTLLSRMEWRDDTTIHGLRACFKTWASQATSYPTAVVEAAMAHVNENEVEAAYLRTDFFEQRIALMNDWARFCTTPPATS